MAEVQSDQRPIFLTPKLKVRFSLKKDESGDYRCVNVKSENEEKIEVLSSYQKLSDRLSRTAVLEGKRFTGKIEFFNHNKSWGKVTISGVDELPAEVADNLKGQKSVYFHRDDLISVDKICGVEKDQEVSYELYQDERGLGATNIKTADNESLSGFTPPITQKKPEGSNRITGRKRKYRGGFRGGRGRGRGGWNNGGGWYGGGRGKKTKT
eukprot:UN25429